MSQNTATEQFKLIRTELAELKKTFNILSKNPIHLFQRWPLFLMTHIVQINEAVAVLRPASLLKTSNTALNFVLKTWQNNQLYSKMDGTA